MQQVFGSLERHVAFIGWLESSERISYELEFSFSPEASSAHVGHLGLPGLICRLIAFYTWAKDLSSVSVGPFILQITHIVPCRAKDITTDVLYAADLGKRSVLNWVLPIFK